MMTVCVQEKNLLLVVVMLMVLFNLRERYISWVK